MDSKIKTGLFETTLRKPSPGSLRVPKLNRSITSRSEPTSPSPTQRSLDRSSANSETFSERRSRKVPTPPEKTRTSSVVGSSEPQPRLSQIKEDLRKANELITSLEIEKAKALDELEQAREEAFEKLYVSLEAEKMAKENFEIEKFKAVEAGLEASHRKEEELKKELEIVKNQHASDSAVLLLVTRELEKVTQELVAANDAKSRLKSQADDDSKTSAILSSKLLRYKAMFDSTREKETTSNKENSVLKSELEKARAEVKERERIIEKLDAEIEILTMDKSNAHGSADQWCNKAIELEKQLEKANMMKRSASASLVSLTKQLEVSKEETVKLKNELETVKEEKKDLLKREQDANSSLQMLLEEKRKILSEAREMKEKLLSLGSADYETHVEDLKLVIKATNEKYEKMLHEVEQTNEQYERSMLDWEIRETSLVNYVKKFDEEVSSRGKEIDRLGNLVKKTKDEADAALKKESQMRDDLKEVEDEVSCLQETLRESRAESLKLNAKMLDKESEFQSVIHENDSLRVKYDDSLKKIKELSKMLEEALVKKDAEEDDCDLRESELDYDLIPKVVEFSEVNGSKEDSSDGNDDDTVEVEYSMWESYHTGKKETSSL